MKSVFRRIQRLFKSDPPQPANSQAAPVRGTGKRQTELLVIPPSLPASRARNQFFDVLFPAADKNQALTVPQKLVLDVMSRELAQDQQPKAVPRLPSVIPRLLRSLRDPDASAADYVKIISKDPAMASGVLKLANSVYFNPLGSRIYSIDTAVVKLGIEGLRSVLSAAVMQPIISYPSPWFKRYSQRLWQHSLAAAVACEIAARQRGLEPFKAYLLGLVHDLGKLVIFSQLCQQFSLNQGDQPPQYTAFVPLLQLHSPTLSYQIGVSWELPEELTTALREQIQPRAGQAISPYGLLLFQCNIACEAYLADQFLKISPPTGLLAELNLPADLYRQLDQLAMEVEQLQSS